VAMPRKDMNDWAFRMWPRFAYNSQTKRNFIFYDYQGPINQHAIMMVTKPLDSSVFSLEQKVCTNCFLDITSPILISKDLTNPNINILHLYYRDLINGETYYTESRNQGLIWENPKKVNENEICNMKPNLRLFKIIGEQQLFGNYLIAVCGGLNENYYLRISQNQGKEWLPKPLPLPMNIIKDWTFCVNHEQEKFLFIHYIIDGEISTPKLGYVNIKNYEFKEIVYPEINYGQFARNSLTCMDNKNGKLRLMLEILESDFTWKQKIYENDL